MEKLLLEILNELRIQNSSSCELWSTEDIARYMRLSRSSVHSRVICRHDFPRAVRIPTDSGLGGRRWYSKEVKAWVVKNREPMQR
jgi:predicted DNA-binding transcriptional regulator AlpA